jgi:hypothetical protein
MIIHGAATPDSEEPGAIVVPIVDSTEHPHVPCCYNSRPNEPLVHGGDPQRLL